MNRSGPGIYHMCILYWYILVYVEWFVVHLDTYLSNRAVVMEFFYPM